MLRKVIAFFVLVAAIAGGGAWAEWRALHERYRGFTASEVFVELPQGAPSAQIATLLANAGVVSDAMTFRLAMRLSHADRRLQAGEYRFTDAATPDEIIARLSRGDTFSRGVTFPEGLSIQEMSAIFERAGMGTADEFIHAANMVSLVSDLDPDAANLEGYLFPSTYALPRRAGAEGLVRAMIKEFRKAPGRHDGARPRDARVDCRKGNRAAGRTR